MATVSTEVEVEIDEDLYPSADGEPIAETQVHVYAIFLLMQALYDYFPPMSDVYISADSFWYWEKGNPRARRAPDIMVVKGVGQHKRRSFFTWREHGAIPCVIVEFASKSTWRENLHEKRRLYERLGVREYFIFDAEGLYLDPVVRAFRLVNGLYVEFQPDADDRYHCEELGLGFRAEGEMLRMIELATGRLILTPAERDEQYQVAAEKERAKLEATQRQAELERARADEEKQKRESLEAEIAQLRALLAQRPAANGHGDKK